MIRFKFLPTEQHNPASKFLDRLSTFEIIRLMNRENANLPGAIRKEEKNIEKAVKMIVQALRSNGRMLFVGAGTSGRLGVLESAELPPTFNTPPGLAQGVMAGGKTAVFRSQEGAEDREVQARREVVRRAKKGDIVIGIAASGVTPFVKGALDQARKIKARSILVTCNAQKSSRTKADVVIAPKVGPEIISGSTRLKSATVTKMILNMLTTIAMVRLGKVLGNRMVDLQPRSKKLKERGIRLIQELAHLPRGRAEKYFKQSQWNVKTAVLMARKKMTLAQAKKILDEKEGNLSDCLEMGKGMRNK